MIVPKSVRIDLNSPRKEVIHLTQDDNTRQAKVMLYVDGRAYDVTADTDGATVEMAVAYILPNGYGDQYTETELGEPAVVQDPAIKNLYTINIDGPCTDNVGVVELLIKFTTEAGQILHSFPLTLNVKRSRGSDVDPDGGSPTTSRYLRKDLQTPATEDMTQPVGVTPEGLLVTAPGGGGGSGTVNPAAMGFAYSTSSTAQATSPKTTGTVSGFALKQYAIVVVRFSNPVNSGQKLNFSETGAKDIYFRNAEIGSGIIAAGDTVTFQYDGTRYCIISIDKAPVSQTDDSNYFIHLTPSPGGGGAMLTDRTASDIYTALAANTDLNFILIDGSGRQAHFTKKPTSANDSAEFTLVANGNQITYTLPTNGGNTVTITTESIIGGGGGTLQHAYGFISQAAYDTFVQDYPDAIQPGDFISIAERAQNNVAVRIYQRNDLGTYDELVTTIEDSYIVTLTESAGSWSANHDGTPVSFAEIVRSGVDKGKRIMAYLSSLGLYIPADYIFTTGSNQYIQFDAMTASTVYGSVLHMGQSFIVDSSGVHAYIKTLGKVIVHATTQDNGASYFVDYYASQIITMRQYNANIVLVDSLTGDEYPLIGDNGGTAAYFGGFNRGMTKTVLFTVFNATNVPNKSETEYPPSGGGGGGGSVSENFVRAAVQAIYNALTKATFVQSADTDALFADLEQFLPTDIRQVGDTLEISGGVTVAQSGDTLTIT